MQRMLHNFTENCKEMQAKPCFDDWLSGAIHNIVVSNKI